MACAIKLRAASRPLAKGGTGEAWIARREETRKPHDRSVHDRPPKNQWVKMEPRELRREVLVQGTAGPSMKTIEADDRQTARGLGAARTPQSLPGGMKAAKGEPHGRCRMRDGQ